MTHHDDKTKVTTEVADSPHELDGHRLAWPDALALTLLIGFWAMVCAGWFDPMLPWVK